MSPQKERAVIEVKVTFFAMLKEQKGTDCATIQLAAPVSLGDLYQTLFPRTDSYTPVCVTYARNGKMSQPNTLVEDGDDVAFLPPLGGG